MIDSYNNVVNCHGGRIPWIRCIQCDEEFKLLPDLFEPDLLDTLNLYVSDAPAPFRCPRCGTYVNNYKYGGYRYVS